MPRVDKSKIAKKSAAETKKKTAELVKKSVKPSSMETYTSHLKSFSVVLSALRETETSDPLSVSKDELLSIIIELEEQGVGCAKGWIAALKKAAASESMTLPFLDHGDVKAAAEACERSAKRKRLPCGTLTEEQISALRVYLDETGSHEMFYAVTILAAASLRVGELGHAQPGDMVVEGGVGMLTLHQHKQSRDGLDENPEPKPVTCALLPVFRAVAKLFPDAAPKLFRKGIDARLREELPNWAKHFKWDPKLRWTGPHVFRHTGAGALDKFRDRVADAVLAVFAQQSDTTRKHYAKNASERVRRAEE